MACQPAAETLASWPQLSDWVSSVSDQEQPITHSRQPMRSGVQRKIAGSALLSRCGLAIGPDGRVSQGIVFGAGQVAAVFARGKALRLETAHRPWLVCSKPIPSPQIMVGGGECIANAKPARLHAGTFQNRARLRNPGGLQGSAPEAPRGETGAMSPAFMLAENRPVSAGIRRPEFPNPPTGHCGTPAVWSRPGWSRHRNVCGWCDKTAPELPRHHP